MTPFLLSISSQFDDKINLGDFGTRNYRITAVSFDNQKSNKSKELTVKLPGHPPIAPPFLADISSEPGMVRLNLRQQTPVTVPPNYCWYAGIPKKTWDWLSIMI